MEIELNIVELVQALEPGGSATQGSPVQGFLKYLEGHKLAKESEDHKSAIIPSEVVNDLFNLYNQFKNNPTEKAPPAISSNGKGILDLHEHLYSDESPRPKITAPELKNLFEYAKKVNSSPSTDSPSTASGEVGRLTDFGKVSLRDYNKFQAAPELPDDHEVLDIMDLYTLNRPPPPSYPTPPENYTTFLKKLIETLKADESVPTLDSPADMLIVKKGQEDVIKKEFQALNQRFREARWVREGSLDVKAVAKLADPDNQVYDESQIKNFIKDLKEKSLAQGETDRLNITDDLKNNLPTYFNQFKNRGKIELNVEDLVQALEPEETSKEKAREFLVSLANKNDDAPTVLLDRNAVNDLFNAYSKYKAEDLYLGVAPTISEDGKGILDLFDHLYSGHESPPPITAKELRSLFDYAEELRKSPFLLASDKPAELGRLGNFGQASLHDYNMSKVEHALEGNQMAWDPFAICTQLLPGNGDAILTEAEMEFARKFLAELKGDSSFAVPSSPENIVIIGSNQRSAMTAKFQEFTAREMYITLDSASLAEALEPGYKAASGDGKAELTTRLRDFSTYFKARGQLKSLPDTNQVSMSAKLANDLFREYEIFKNSPSIGAARTEATGKGPLDVLAHHRKKAIAVGETFNAADLRGAHDYITDITKKNPALAGVLGQLKDDQTLKLHTVAWRLDQFKIARSLKDGNKVLNYQEVFHELHDDSFPFTEEQENKMARFCRQLVQDRGATGEDHGLIVVTEAQSLAMKSKFRDFQKMERALEATKGEIVFNAETLAKFLFRDSPYDLEKVKEFMEDLITNTKLTGATGKDGKLNVTKDLITNLEMFHQQYKDGYRYSVIPTLDRSDTISTKRTYVNDDHAPLLGTHKQQKDKRPMTAVLRENSTLLRTYSVGEDTGRTNRLIVEHANEWVENIDKKLKKCNARLEQLELQTAEPNQTKYQQDRRERQLAKVYARNKKLEERVNKHNTYMNGLIKRRNGELDLSSNTTIRSAMKQATGTSLKNSYRWIASNSYQGVGRHGKKLKTPLKWLGIVGVSPIALAIAIGAGIGVAAQGMTYVAARTVAGVNRGAQKMWHKSINAMGRKAGLTLRESWQMGLVRLLFKPENAAVLNAKMEQRQIKRMASLLKRVEAARKRQANINHREAGFEKAVSGIKGPFKRFKRPLVKYYNPERFKIAMKRMTANAKPSDVKGFYKARKVVRDSIKGPLVPANTVELADKKQSQKAWIAAHKAGKTVWGFTPDKKDYELLATSLVRDWGRENRASSGKENVPGGAQVQNASDGDILRPCEVLFENPKTKEVYVFEHPHLDSGAPVNQRFGQVKILSQEQQRDMGLTGLKPKQHILAMKIGTNESVDLTKVDAKQPAKKLGK